MEKITISGYDAGRLALFAEACKNAGITDDDLKDFHGYVSLAIREAERLFRESVIKSFGDHFVGGNGTFVGNGTKGVCGYSALYSRNLFKEE